MERQVLYIAFEAPFTELTMREPSGKERLRLWEDDVVEMFVGADPNNAKKYQEFEWASRRREARCDAKFT